VHVPAGGTDSSGVYVEGPQAAVSNAGTIQGGAGLALVSSDGIIVTTGSILGLRYYGVTVNASAAVDLFNSGTIGGRAGLQSIDSIGLKVTNSGTIFATDPTQGAIEAETAANLTIRNSGQLLSAGLAVNCGTGADKLVNTGSIDGDVLLGAGNDLYRGTRGTVNGDVYGGDGNDTLIGGVGNDRIDGGRGDDELRGNNSRDTFVFHRGDGNDLVADFANGKDRLDLSAIGFASFAAVAAKASDTAAGMLIDLADFGGGTVLLADFTKAQFNAADVILA
jgi:Ca2+-binding RTX toxin-like protein